MTLRFHYQETAGSAEPFVEATRSANLRWQILSLDGGYDSFFALEFRVWSTTAHTPAAPAYPIPVGGAVVLWDDSIASSLTGGSFDDPIFEGFVTEKPVRSDENMCELLYQALEPIAHAETGCFVLSGAWAAPPTAGDPPDSGNEYPRRIYNVKTEADPDFGWQSGSRDDMEVGEIIADVIADCREWLKEYFAAPSDGSSATVSGDLTPLDHKPQLKIVFEGTTVTSAINSLLQDRYPGYKLIFHPGVGAGRRQWRIRNILTAPVTTVRLNDNSSPKKFLSLNLQSTNQGRYSAVRIFGPPVPTREVFDTTGGSPTLTELWTLTDENNLKGAANGTDNSVSADSTCRQWQITDTAKRHISYLLASHDFVAYPYSDSASTTFEFDYRRVFRPYLLVKFASESTRLYPVFDVVIDNKNGIVSSRYKIARRIPGAGSSPYFEVPSEVYFVCCFMDDPIDVRAPSTGYEGDIFTTDGIKRELLHFDEGLAVGRRNGVPETSTDRETQYTTLAQAWLDAMKDSGWTGGGTQKGIDYDWLRLNKRLNFTLGDGLGGSGELTWELTDVNLLVTGVRYDFGDRPLTTLTFNRDLLVYLEGDPERLKEQLRIDSTFYYDIYDSKINISINGVNFGIPDAIGLNSEPYLLKQDETLQKYQAIIPADQRYGEGGVSPMMLDANGNILPGGMN